MAGLSPFYSPASQQAFPTPSPFARSIASSTALSSPAALLNASNLVLRSSAFIFSAVAALALAAPSPDKENKGSFNQVPEFRYAFWTTILASVYSASQLFKGISEIAFQGRIMSDKAYDYITFFLDQLVGYLLISSSSVAVSGIDQMSWGRLKQAAIASVCMTFAAFFAIAASGLLSGYRLCKRITW